MAANGIAEIAFERAWRVYRLINRREVDHGARRIALEQFISKCCEQGATDTEAIMVLALIHLKQLDESAAHREMGGTPSRSGKNGTSDPATG
jgi:hypothetical protein